MGTMLCTAHRILSYKPPSMKPWVQMPLTNCQAALSLIVSTDNCPELFVTFQKAFLFYTANADTSDQLSDSAKSEKEPPVVRRLPLYLLGRDRYAQRACGKMCGQVLEGQTGAA